MATVGVQPIVLVDATLTVGADDFSAAVSRVEFVPDVTVEWLPGPMSTGAARPLFKGIQWTCGLTYAQDLAPGSLARYLLDHAGDTRVVAFTPVDGGPTVSATLTLIPGRLGGGEEDVVLTAEADLPVWGAPEVA